MTTMKDVLAREKRSIALLEAVDATLREQDAVIDDVLNVTLHIAVLAAKEFIPKEAFLKIASDMWEFDATPVEVH